MNDKDALEIIEKVMTDENRVTFGLSTMDVYLLLSYLQVAYRFPGMSKVMRGHMRHIADQIMQAITTNHPEAIQIIEKGWDAQFDREQGSISPSERDWIEGKNRCRSKR